jgi:hypothetical protein
MFNLTLWDKGNCPTSGAPVIPIENVQLPGGYRKYTFVGLELKVSTNFIYATFNLYTSVIRS